jgi:hypothetical protein
MPFNSLQNIDDLINEEVREEILQEVPQESAVLTLGRRLPDMPTSVAKMPVLSILPIAYPVNGANGLKQTTEVEWTHKHLTAEEIAVIVPIPKSYLDDSSYDVWGQVKPLIKQAAGKLIDSMVIYGTDIFDSWETDLGAAGLVARALAASQTLVQSSYDDLYGAVLGEEEDGTAGLFGMIEEDGYGVTGVIAALTMKRKFRGCRDADGNPIFKSGANIGNTFATGDLDGARVLYPLNGAVDSSQSLLIAGDFSKLVYAIRQDLSFDISDQGTIFDNAGKMIFSLFQQDMIALRATIRLAVAAPNPINPIQSSANLRCPFAVMTA